jgi:uncharacterized protein (TIGR03437 family)
MVARIPASDVAAVGRAAIDVLENMPGAGASNTVNFTIGPAPIINAGGIINAANALDVKGVAPGSIVSLYGANLAPKLSVADVAPPLPSTLGGVTVVVPGVEPLPLFFVAPGQINFQVPWFRVTNNTSLQITVRQGTLPGNTGTMLLQPFAPALFTVNQQGTGQAAARIAGTAIIPAPAGMFPGSRPAKAGEYVELYGTGLGSVSNTPPTGSPSPANPLARTLSTVKVTIGGQDATVTFAGLAPGLVGAYQIDAQVPANSSGDAVPVTVNVGGVASNSVTISIE